jgi:hypothetical protein
MNPRLIKNIFAVFFSTLLFMFSQVAVEAQVTLSGPSCVVAGNTYEYTINGNWSATSTMQLCVTGGVIADSTDSTCTAQSAPLGRVFVTWNDSSTSSGMLSITSSIGNASLNISYTTPLIPGSVDILIKTQFLTPDSLPSIIGCSAGSGSSCSPNYVYQWQQSYDALMWEDMPGETAQQLSFSAPLELSTYYHRKVIETSSGTVGFSDIAAIIVTPVASPPDSSSGFINHYLKNSWVINNIGKGHPKINYEDDRTVLFRKNF